MSRYEMSEEKTYIDDPVSTKEFLPERESHRLMREDFLRGRELACSSHWPFSFPEHRNWGSSSAELLLHETCGTNTNLK